jgi:hypothetical protein
MFFAHEPFFLSSDDSENYLLVVDRSWRFIFTIRISAIRYRKEFPIFSVGRCAAEPVD